MSRLAQFVILSWGWPRQAIAFLSGALGVLALAPFGFWPAMFCALIPAIWLLDGTSLAAGHLGSRKILQTVKSAAIVGWWFGFGFFLAGLWWLGSAVLYEADQFAWALPLAVVGLPAGLALFTAISFALAALFWTPGLGRIGIFAICLALSEYARAHVLTGFPWNEVGMSLGTNLILGQMASVVGLHGLTLLAAFVFALPAAALTRGTQRRLLSGPALLSASLLIGFALFGVWRLSGDMHLVVPDVRLRLVQPNISQDAFLKGDQKDTIVETYLKLSDRATSPRTSGVADITHLIWPESAFPFILSRDRNTLDRIGSLLQRGSVLITGAARVGEIDSKPNRPVYYNAMQVLAGSGVIVESYDKVHLVPFGEYVPGHRWLEKLGLRQLVSMPGGFEPGVSRRVLNVPGLPPVAPLICYEAIFPGEVISATPNDPKPHLLLNISNDAWFGLTPGPYQHFAQAKLRTIEEGLPLVRVANTGISAVVDAYGQVLASLPLGVGDILDSDLPRALPETIYAQYRDQIFWALAGLLFVFAVLTRRVV